MTKRTKKRNQADATLRNVRAANRRIDALEADVKQLREQIAPFVEAARQSAEAKVAHHLTSPQGDARLLPTT